MSQSGESSLEVENSASSFSAPPSSVTSPSSPIGIFRSVKTKKRNNREKDEEKTAGELGRE